MKEKEARRVYVMEEVMEETPSKITTTQAGGSFGEWPSNASDPGGKICDLGGKTCVPAGKAYNPGGESCDHGGKTYDPGGNAYDPVGSFC